MKKKNESAREEDYEDYEAYEPDYEGYEPDYEAEHYEDEADDEDVNYHFNFQRDLSANKSE